MTRNVVRRLGRRRAFTLLEVLMVIVILGVLAALVAPRIMGSGEDAKKKATALQLKTLEEQLERFKIECGRYPTESEGLNALLVKPDAEDIAEKWTGKYIKEAPNDAWGKAINYRVPGQYNADAVDLWSSGPNGTEGDDDDIKNWKQG